MFHRKIYLSGGGTNSISLGGALGYLEQKGFLKHVKEWMGISAGGLAAMCLVADYSIAEMKRFWLEFDYEAVMDPDIASGWFTNLGYDTGNRLQKLINALLHEKGHADTITFEELSKKSGKSLRVWATNIRTGALVEFSDKSTPTYCVAHAVRASMTLPYYFQPFICPLTNEPYIDGAVITNYPLHYLSDADREETLGLLITYKSVPLKSLELEDYIMRPLSIYTQERSHVDYQRFKSQTVRINIEMGSPVDFGMSVEKKRSIIEAGTEAAKAFLKDYRKPVRRYSVS